MSRTYNVAIVGATGAVGREVMRLLEERKFPVGQLTLFGRETLEERRLPFDGDEIPINALTAASFKGANYAIFSAGSPISKEWAPIAVQSECVVIDNSSAFRMDPKVPLVIPEINGSSIKGHNGIIANPNCTTAITLMALHPLHKRWWCEHITATSFQAVSGTGAKGMAELEQQAGQYARKERITGNVYPHQIAFNVIPEVGDPDKDGYTTEELKMEREGRKIWGHLSFRASMTCTRAPVFRSHSVSVLAEFKQEPSVEEARELLKRANGVKLLDDLGKHEYPMPLDVSRQNDCFVGRIRKGRFNPKTLNLWVVGDQLLKGAALNAVQILEKLTGTSPPRETR